MERPEIFYFSPLSSLAEARAQRESTPSNTKDEYMSKMMRNWLLFVVMVMTAGIAMAAGSERMGWKSGSYPKIGNLWGCDITKVTDYDKWAKWDLLVASGPGGDVNAWRKFSRELKARHPDIIVLATGAMADLTIKENPWMKDGWLLRHPNGDKVAWWADQLVVPNLMLDDAVNAIVQHAYEDWDGILKDGIVDGLFFDCVAPPYNFFGPIDVDGDGKADNSPELDRKWMARQLLILDRLRDRWPKVLILANDIRSGHAMHTNGRFYEGGKILDPLIDDVVLDELVPDPTVERGGGPFDVRKVMKTIDGWKGMSLQPWLTFATMTNPQGWQEFRVGKVDPTTGVNTATTAGETERCRRDYPRMRLGLLISLMTDVYYQYDFGTVWYGFPWWYAEYDAPLGRPVSEAREVSVPGGSYLERKFEGGMALLNPNRQALTIKPDQTMRRLSDGEAPRYIVEVDDVSSDFSSQGPWEIRKTNERSYGKSWRMNSYRVVATAGNQASWQFTAPSTDTYAVFACLPGGEEFTKSASYSLAGDSRVAASVDQRKADGNWVKLFEAKLQGGKRYAVNVTSGDGATVADAIRVESKARYNDGARVRELRLEGLDGIILLNR
jgi:hypothetical protein